MYMLLYWSVDPYKNMYNFVLKNRVQCIDKDVYYYNNVNDYPQIIVFSVHLVCKEEMNFSLKVSDF